MGIFSRLVALIKSNLNDLISKSEDPEKMLNQIVLDMNTQLIEAKKQVAVSITDEKRLRKQYETEQLVAADWEKRAMLAVRAGEEELAKEALLRKREHETVADELRVQWEKHSQAVESLKKALRLLNDKIEEAKRKKNMLIAKKKRAEAAKAVHETMQGIRSQSSFETFDKMAQKIDHMEAEVEASSELQEEFTGDVLSARFEEMERKRGADEELLALKRKMGIISPESSTPEAVKREVKQRVDPVLHVPTEEPGRSEREEEALASDLAELEALAQAEKVHP